MPAKPRHQNPPVSLEKLLGASVDYISEKQRQEELAACVASSSLPSDYALYITHSELQKLVSHA